MHIVKDGCPGCGACLGICPVDALVPQDLGMNITESCIDCGICPPACPVGLIERAAEKPVVQSSFESPAVDDYEKEGGA
ncbi:MAG TPA: 4Fe-4S dicluster domain-containing protein [Syntrophomonadaceae bacterium]|nr:4Fe-4S dicluster domain-containing protein [Syntrophomonadaceae bacterium]